MIKPSYFHYLGTVLRHESKDFFRDKSTLKTMLVLLLLMPVLYSYIIGNMKNKVQEVFDREKRLGYIDQAEIHEILPWLQQQGVIAVPVKERSHEVFTTQQLDAILTILPKDVLDSPDLIRTDYEIWTNGFNQKKKAAAAQILQMINGYAHIVATHNIIMAGAAPEILEPFTVKLKSMQSEPSSGFVTYDFLMGLIGMALFLTTLHLAVDATAGERERMTLESLLYTEAPRSSLVIGKFLVVASIAFLGMCWVGVVFWSLGEVSIFQTLLGRSSSFSLKELGITIALMSPLCLLVASLQIFIGAFSTSVKQAQAYNSVSVLMSLPLAFLLFIEHIKPLYYAPIFGQGLAIRKILQNENWDVNGLVTAQLLSLAITALLLLAVINRFQQEKIIL